MRWLTMNVVVLVAAAYVGGCGFDPSPAMPRPPGPTGGPGRTTNCTNISCQQSTCRLGNCTQPACTGRAPTRITGRVFDPAGKVPLYNISVFVPNKPLAPYTDGPTCDTCEAGLSGEPLVWTTTDANGNFVLGDPTNDVPSGANIPLVMQVGKWRREITIPNVAACTDLALTDTNVTRLPRNQSEGHLPKIALTTGGADALECLLRKIGISDSEFTTPTGTGRVNFFAGVDGSSAYNSALGGASFTSVAPWWDNVANLNKYDMILHSCEGTEDPTNKSQAARQALRTYADAGGRVFASHWHNYWFEFGPAPWPDFAQFNHQSDLNNINATIDTSFEKGVALADWLVNVGGSTTRGVLPLTGAQQTNDGIGTAQRWIYTTNPQSVQYLSATTPVGGPNVCGKVVLSDIHVSVGAGGANDDVPGEPFPDGCRTTDLSPQEKTLEFMIFDLSACVGIIVP